MNKKFDTNVQEIKYEVLKSIVEAYLSNTMNDLFYETPKKIVKDKPTTRCCIYKERAIVQERIRLALDNNRNKDGIVEVINIACDQCETKKYVVSNCKGCLAKRCERVCPRDAIYFENQKAIIDQSKCIKCGKCYEACSFNAISCNERPCEKGCKVGAIKSDENGVTKIDYSKCIDCGQCVYQCPFGAVVDRSFILDSLNLLSNKDEEVYAIIAPSFASQFTDFKPGTIITGLKELGFKDVYEAALGADIVSYKEAYELKEKGFLTSSCCPSFVKYIKKNFKEYADYISHNNSPMKEVGLLIKKNNPNAKVIFIGPCISKKVEGLSDDIIDCVLTFEELQALFDGYKIDLSSLEESEINNASYYGRIFARSGGLSEAVSKVYEEENLDFDVETIICNGFDEIRIALLKNKNLINKKKIFIEGMFCEDGCIGGPGCLKHNKKSKELINTFSKNSKEKTIKGTIKLYNNTLNCLKEE